MDRFCTSWSGSSPADQHLVSVFYGVELQSLLVAVDLKLCPDHLHTDMGQNMSEQATATAPVRSSSFKMKSRIFTDTQRPERSGWAHLQAGVGQLQVCSRNLQQSVQQALHLLDQHGRCTAGNTGQLNRTRTQHSADPL